MASGDIVGTERIEDAEHFDPRPNRKQAALLRHERIPFISYPYEWPFSMLKDAALLQLELLEQALSEDLILKDSSPYNIQWRGASPSFVDVGSFERLRSGEPWIGYRQFCMLFLYPLLLQALKDVPFQPRLRGAIDGIPPEEMANLLSFRDRFRRGVMTSVFLHARLERRYAKRGREVRDELREAGFKKELIVANVRRLSKLVRRLAWDPPEGVWTSYGEENSYSDQDAREKDEFVRQAATSREWGLVWDLGCNNGRHSRIAAERAKYVVAVDGDQGAVELLYRSLREERERKILPLMVNLADPSPGLGWRGAERPPLRERGQPELVLALALVHHLSIAANVPIRAVVEWLRELGAALVVEFPMREDPMVELLLSAKREKLHPDYDLEVFERHLGEAFDVRSRTILRSGTRVLYFATPKGDGGLT